MRRLSGTTKHENAVKNTGKMPALPAFSHTNAQSMQ